MSDSLKDRIALEIRTTGPMSIATYMALCLSHPRDGYYRQGRPIGSAGDFITAPEISQMFGELIGFFFVNLWQQIGEPKSFTLLELGPGRGTLMADLLRAATKADGFADALHLQLFESSPPLRTEQATRLGDYHPYWSESLDVAAGDPVFVIANEFFDALPLRQYVRATDGWHERLVGHDGDTLMFGLSPIPIANDAMPVAVQSAAPGEIYETNLAAARVIQQLSTTIARQGGALLAIDYGYARTQTGDTLQAVRDHGFANVLDRPGETDLSAHVDFETLAAVATTAGLVAPPLATQGDFLMRLGIAERAKSLARANPQTADAIATALTRLTAPEAMGTLFKVLCIMSPGLQPAGFAA
ncbi:MAG: class SAM-dependent methyltransferase [Devosia sp.]|nr:class SAM-dependent methyltransferase [Devosia sp.]